MKGKNIMSHRHHLYAVSRWDTLNLYKYFLIDKLDFMLFRQLMFK